ncbi:sensor histidine kinase [Planctomycetota bacterium]
MVDRLKQIDPSNRQFRWVITLLIGAVVLPTVCLLWFMGQALRNVDSATFLRQSEFYEETLQGLTLHNNKLWRSIADLTDEADALSPTDLYQTILKGRTRIVDGQTVYADCANGVLVYDAQGQLAYPDMRPSESHLALNEPQMFRVAWRLEFVVKDHNEAAREYRNAARSSDDPAITLRAHLGEIRCLYQAGRMNEAIALSENILFDPLPAVSEELAQQVMHLRLQLIEQLAKVDPQRRTVQLRRLLIRLGTFDHEQAMLPSENRVFILRKTIALADAVKDPNLEEPIQRVRKMFKSETLCLSLAERFPRVESLGKWDKYTVRNLDPNEGIYAFPVQAREKTLLVLMERNRLGSCLNSWLQTQVPQDMRIRILDDVQQVVLDKAPPQSPALLSIPLCDYFPGWDLEVVVADDDVLAKMAARQRLRYVWTAGLVILMLVLLGLTLSGAMRRQARLHQLKNDFIATVTHELKTPLASMRLLVDTLIEGRYRDAQQVTEYLQLVAKENARLTGLIENFLTFSRMERNKRTFTIQATPGRDIALDAAEAMSTKLTTSTCRFTADIPTELADVVADHDAMVTVLVNLLDNAYKYSGDDKEIVLGAREQNGHVCFRVTDNGLGIPRRAQKRIFSKFYQVDRRLTRPTEGCGLGLSIVRFIVDAHHGSVRVESRVGKGSTFTVCIPKG